jgi:hypothetical protein
MQVLKYSIQPEVWERTSLLKPLSLVALSMILSSLWLTTPALANVTLQVPTMKNGVSLPDSSWANAPSTGVFTSGIDGKSRSSNINCAFMRSAESLFAKCTVREDPASLHTASDAASIQKGDFLALGLTVSTNPMVQYIFFANANGVQSATGTTANASQTTWNLKVTKTSATWTALFGIPFKSLQLPTASEADWRLGALWGDTSHGGVWVWPAAQNPSPINPATQAILTGLPHR